MRIISSLAWLLVLGVTAMAQTCPADHPNLRQVQDYTKSMFGMLSCPTTGSCSLWPITCTTVSSVNCPPPVTSNYCLSNADLMQAVQAPPSLLQAPAATK